MTPEFLTLPDRRLAYQRQSGRTDLPGVMFLGGFASDMTGTKATFLAERCREAGIAFLRFDYRGHGRSDGQFTDGTIGDWFRDSCALLDLTKGPQILVGSSMGGWLGLMLAMQRPERMKAFIGIAAAPDFTEDLMLPRLTPSQHQALSRDGFILDETAPPHEQAPITRRLIEEARQHLLLRGPIRVSCAIRLMQGMEDKEVPWGHALRIVQHIPHDDVRITLIKDGDHRLSRPADLDLLWQTIAAFYAASSQDGAKDGLTSRLLPPSASIA